METPAERGSAAKGKCGSLPLVQHLCHPRVGIEEHEMGAAVGDASTVAALFQTVVAGGYCIGCGACAAMEGSAIAMEFDKYGRFCAGLPAGVPPQGKAPEVLAVCPFADGSSDEDEISAMLYGRAGRLDRWIGYYLATYAGFVTEADFRQRGSSGGMGKWLLYKLLERHVVDAVIQVLPSSGCAAEGLLYRYGVAPSAEEVKNGSKSAYYPVEMSRFLQHVRTHAGRYAVTGLPCFIKAIRLLARHEPVFRERIRFCVGLMCGHLKSARYAEMLAWQVGCEPENLISVDFRKKLAGRRANEKGVAVAARRNGATVIHTGVVQELFGASYNLGLFKLQACDYCDDVAAETADIVIGDAWLPEYVTDGRGTSLVVVRHPELQEILEQEESAGHVCLERISSERVLQSQEAGFRHRREGLSYRLYLKDRAGAWRPSKRVEAQSRHLSKQRRQVYEFRVKLMEESHEIFRRALETADFAVFQKPMRRLLSRYQYVQLAGPLWQRWARRGWRTARSALRRCHSAPHAL